MGQWTFLWLTVILFYHTRASDVRFPTNRNGDRFTSLIVKSDTGTIYVAENRLIHRLDMDLKESKKSISTCDGKDCENINKVMTMDNDLLIICGTGKNQTCQALNGSNVQKYSSSHNSDQNYLAVSADLKRPAVGLAVNGNFYLGVTYGADLKTTINNTYKYLISRTNVTQFSPVAKVNLKDPTNGNNNIIDNYIVYFRKIFHHNGFIYFLTNQKLELSANSYSSKLVRICINETYDQEGGFQIKSYTDIVLTCDVDGKKYNLLQDAEFLPIRGILVAVFSIGDNPENPTTESAICVYSIVAVNNAILQAKEDFITCVSENLTFYLDTLQKACVEPKEYRSEEYICPQLGEIGVRVIGNKPLQPNSTHKLEGGGSKITKVKGVERYEKYPDVYIGTDSGDIKKVSIDEDLTIFLYENSVVDKGHAVRDIHIADGEIFVLSNRKLFKHKERDCSVFTTCHNTTKRKNPLCGWCVIENRSSKKNNCSDQETWLPPFSTCVSAEVSPRYIPVNTATNITLHLSKNFPRISQQFKCSYHKGKSSIGGNVRAIKITDQSVQCSTPNFSEHSELTVQLLIQERNTYLVEGDFMVYRCENFSSCSSCLVSASVACNWCSEELQCKESCSGSHIAKGENTKCPKLLNKTDIYVPSGRSKIIFLEGENLVPTVTYGCIVNGSYLSDAVLHAYNSTLSCPINVSIEDSAAKKEIPIAIQQMQRSSTVKLEDADGSSITVYRCEILATDCTMCSALRKDKYDCHWCQDGHCGENSSCTANYTCPLPAVTKVEPIVGGYRGNTEITLTGKNFGMNAADISGVKVGEKDCGKKNVTQTPSPDFQLFNQQIKCVIPAMQFNSFRGSRVNITLTFNGTIVTAGVYRFGDPNVTLMLPDYGPTNGGTVTTLLGNDLNVGNQLDRVRLGDAANCLSHSIFGQSVRCTTSSVKSPVKITRVRLIIDGEIYDSYVSFRFLPSPEITEQTSNKSIVSGGSNLTAVGINLKNAAMLTISAQYAGETTEGICTALEMSLFCKSPGAPPSVIKEMEENIMDGGSGQSADELSIDVQITIKMDGYENTFTVTYYRDPIVDEFLDFENTRVFRTSPDDLVITGKYLNVVGGEKDYQISIGMRGRCLVTQVTERNITCIPPTLNPDGDAEKLEVVVNLGFFKKSVGYVKYDFESAAEAVMSILLIVLPILGGLFLIGVLVGIFGAVKYRRVKTKAKRFEDNLANMEMQIKKVFREEFLDMHTTMSRVNESLIEKGFPYNSYQRYSFLMMFPGEWNMEEHPLMYEPVVSDAVRVKLKRGMEAFEELLLNKFFLLSVISTMEKQKKFFLKEKSNMAGYLSVGLLCKMDYFHEILSVLLTNLVSDTQAKSQKTLFRRCESITEKLLSNWLVMSLYPHVKMHSGSPLYMLLKGTQLTMESGPIDAITGDSKYTLSEEKLLKQDDKPNTLTLKIMVDNSDEIQDCKVLDCDTISQVKAKCLSQIYVNFPASQLTVDSSELNLEWHWGIGGRIVIKDEDTSSKREGEWLQLNTLEHYRVQDGSSMALVDPHGMAEQEDYVNLAQIRIDTDPGCDSSIHSNEPLAPRDEEDGGLIIRWHLVKPETDQQKPGTVAIDELYLSRLITTKQSVLEFMKNLFDTILNNTIPPPAKFLFDLLDELGEQNKVDPDSVHAWKSQCYLIRFWATLINKPYNLFDQRIPSYVETSMEVISQVLIESCSLKAQQYTKDSSPAKLVFKNDMMSYRDKVKDYYARVKDHQQSEEDLRQYLTDLNRFQHQQLSFNKQAALYTLYNQLQPYMEEIMDDLENNSETKSLHLDRKLANLNNSMQED